jgi:hypothetical protein
MSSPAELIANNLAALPHPDGAPRQLSGFSTRLLPEALHSQIQQTAKDIGEAVIHLLETNGYTVTNETSQPTQATDEPPQIANIHCHHCDARVLQMNISTPTKVLTGHHFALLECPNQ